MQSSSKIVVLFTVAISFMLFGASNILATKLLSGKQIDLTEDKIYTLSEGTGTTLKSLDEPLKLKLYFSAELANGYPHLQAYATRVKNLLKQYADIAGDKIQLEFINPSSFTSEEDEAVAYGIRGIKVDSLGTRLYFGLLAINSVDETKIIPYLDSKKSAFLEYDLTRMIHNLARNEKPNIAVMGWIPMRVAMTKTLPQPEKPWAVLQQMEQFFNVQYLDKDKTEKIPNDVEILMLVHPSSKNEKQLYAIDQFVMRGGKLLVFADSYTDIAGAETISSNLDELFSNWGLKLAEKEVIGDRNMAVRVPHNYPDKEVLDDITKVTWLEATTADMNPDDVTTGNLSKVRILSPAHVYLTEKARSFKDYSWEPLIISTSDSMAYDNKRLINKETPAQLMDNFKAMNNRYVIAARYMATLPSAFDAKGQGEAHRMQSDGIATIIVVSDVDILRDQLWVELRKFQGKDTYEISADNGAFVINLLDHLSGSEALISLRSRNDTQRPFELVRRLTQEAEIKFREEEKRLEQELSTTNRQLELLRKSMGISNAALLNSSMQQEMNIFRKKMIQIRSKLRDVRLKLRRDIKSLDSQLKWLNIGAVPLILLLFAVIIPMRRRQHR